MRHKISASLALGVMVVRFIPQDEMRALNDKHTNYFAGTTKQGKTNEKKTTKNPISTKLKCPRIIQLLQARASSADPTR